MFAGKGRGLFATTAVKAGDLLIAAAPLALLYCDEGLTPEIEELADHLSAAVAATTNSSSSSQGSSAAAAAAAPLALWQQHALLQLRPPGAAAAAGGGTGVPDLLHLLGDPAYVAAAADAAAGGSSDAEQQEQQQQGAPSLLPALEKLPGLEDVLKLVFANCTGTTEDCLTPNHPKQSQSIPTVSSFECPISRRAAWISSQDEPGAAHLSGYAECAMSLYETLCYASLPRQLKHNKVPCTP